MSNLYLNVTSKYSAPLLLQNMLKTKLQEFFEKRKSKEKP